MANLKEGGLISGRAYNRNIFSLADRWAYNWRGLLAAVYDTDTLLLKTHRFMHLSPIGISSNPGQNVLSGGLIAGIALW